LSNNEMALILDRSAGAIIDRASRNLGLKKSDRYRRERSGNKKYSLDINYFQSINSHEKAYWYGFLWADGCVQKNKVISLCINKRDKETLLNFRRAIGSNHPLKEIYKTGCLQVAFRCAIMYNDLYKLNIIPRKSYSNLMPLIVDQLFSSFLLGIFDGDGHLQKNSLQITNTKETCDFINKKLLQFKLIDTSRITGTGSYASRLYIYRQRVINNLFKYMYQKLSCFMKRKYKRFQAMGYGDGFVLTANMK